MSDSIFPGSRSFFPTGLSQYNVERIIDNTGVRMTWAKSQVCPCSLQGDDGSGYGQEGSPRENCQNCFGLGVYWQPFIPAFKGLIAFGGFLPMPAEPGALVDKQWGPINNAVPLCTIKYTGSEVVWEQASVYDQFVELDTLTRYTTILKVGVQEVVPYFNGLKIYATGAVSVWDAATQSVVHPPYAVVGNHVTLQGYPVGTPYSIEFYAALTYVAFRASGGLPHNRPFGGGVQKFPKRFTVQALDLWLRERRPQGTATGAFPPGGVAYPNIAATGTVLG